MITSRELLAVFEDRVGSSAPTYEDLRTAMNCLEIDFKSRECGGFVITAYLGTHDVAALAAYFDIYLYA